MKLLAPIYTIGTAISQTWDEKVVNGTATKRSEFAGQTTEMVFEAVLGRKVLPLLLKAQWPEQKWCWALNVLPKLPQAMTLESLVAKVKGVFKVGEGNLLL